MIYNVVAESTAVVLTDSTVIWSFGPDRANDVECQM